MRNRKQTEQKTFKLVSLSEKKNKPQFHQTQDFEVIVLTFFFSLRLKKEYILPCVPTPSAQLVQLILLCRLTHTTCAFLFPWNNPFKSENAHVYLSACARCDQYWSILILCLFSLSLSFSLIFLENFLWPVNPIWFDLMWDFTSYGKQDGTVSFLCQNQWKLYVFRHNLRLSPFASFFNRNGKRKKFSSLLWCRQAKRMKWKALTPFFPYLMSLICNVCVWRERAFFAPIFGRIESKFSDLELGTCMVFCFFRSVSHRAKMTRDCFSSEIQLAAFDVSFD